RQGSPLQLDGVPGHRRGHDHVVDDRQDRVRLHADLHLLRPGFRALGREHVRHPDRNDDGRQYHRRRMVAVESNPGDARQPGGRLRLHGTCALHHAQAPHHRAGAANGADASAGRMSEADLKLAAPEQAGDFSPEQKRYLEGFVAGVQIAKAAKSVAGAVTATPGASSPAASAPTGPDAAGLRAQNRVLAAGGKLSDPEKFKREQHPFDTYERLKEHAAKGEYPKPPDNFRWRFFGLFYVAPNENSYMCRLRIPNGIVKAVQFAGLADLAERYGGGYAHVTTRANLQIREVEAHNAVAMIEAIQDLGLCSRGSGADNIRNVTGTPTAGIDPQELIDTRPYAREWHFHILNDRSLYGLPRKFNVAFDGA